MKKQKLKYFYAMNTLERWERCMRKEIGRKLKWLRYNRLDKAYGLKAISDMLNNEISYQAINRFEKATNPKGGEANMLPLLRLYNVSFDWILNGSTEDSHIPEFTDIKLEINSNLISEKIRYINSLDTPPILDDKLSFAYLEIPLAQEMNMRKSSFAGQQRWQFISLFRWCLLNNVSFNWLMTGNIDDMYHGTIPEFSQPKSTNCADCSD